MKYYFLLIGFLFLLFSCRKQKTVWDADWTAPIVNDTLTLDKFVNDTTLSVSSGYYEMNMHRTLMDINMAEIVEIPDTTIQNNFTIAFASMALNPGTSFVNEIEEHDLNLEGIELKRIQLSKGYIDIKLQNPVNTDVLFTIKLPGVTKDGVTFNQTFTAPPGSNSNPGIVEATVDVSSYYMDLTGVDGASFNILQSLFIVKTDPNGESTTITNQDVTKVSATFRDIKLDYARGYFGNQIISDTSETTIDLLTKIVGGAIDFPATNLSITITNGIKLPARAKLTVLSNENGSGNLVPLTVNSQSQFQFGEAFNLDPATGPWDNLSFSNKTIQFTSLNSNLEQYLENLGAKQKIGYSIELNPWGNTSGGWNEIFPNSRLKVSLDVNMPLTIGLDGLVLKDTFDFEVKQNTEKTHVVSGELVLYATNAFPFSGEILIDLLDANGNILHTVTGTNELKSALYGTSYTNAGIQTCSSTIHFAMSEALIRDLVLIKKVVITSEFNTPNPSTNVNEQILIPEGAFLGVKLKGAFKIENRY